MDDKNSSNIRHPLHAALMIFHATVRTAFETAAAFWRPWFREPEKKEVAAREHSKPASEEALQPTKREQKATEKKARGADKTRATAKAINPRSDDGEKAQGADKAFVYRGAGTGARRANPKNRTLTETSTGERSSRPGEKSIQ
jgi:hypothetical protein